jgi:hypothetical protein
MTETFDETLPTEPLSEVDYKNRQLPQRERPSDVGATLLAGAAILCGIATFVTTPFEPGFLGIGLGVIALAVASERNRLAKIGLTTATLGWLIAGLLAVLSGSQVW